MRDRESIDPEFASFTSRSHSHPYTGTPTDHPPRRRPSAPNEVAVSREAVDSIVQPWPSAGGGGKPWGALMVDGRGGSVETMVQD
jgi:hypothetical protein